MEANQKERPILNFSCKKVKVPETLARPYSVLILRALNFNCWKLSLREEYSLEGLLSLVISDEGPLFVPFKHLYIFYTL